MKAAVLKKPGEIEVMEVDRPCPEAKEVLVRVAYCGICGSDLPRVFDGASHLYPNILGHEFSGWIVQVGEGADPGLVGKRVVGIPLIPCGSCPMCEEGNYALCERYGFVGSRRFGALAEYVALPEANVFCLGEGVDLMSAAFFEPLTVALHAMDLMPLSIGFSVAVVGCGTIGVLLGQALRVAGARKVVALARRQKRLDVALRAGIDAVIDTSSESWLAEAFEANGGRRYDFVFDTSGNADMMVASLSLAANKGSICMVGTPKKPVEFSVQAWEQINRRELTVTGSWMSYSAPFPGSEWSRAKELLSTGEVSCCCDLIDTIYDLDHAKEAFDRFVQPAGVTGKILIVCNEKA